VGTVVEIRLHSLMEDDEEKKNPQK
jgi:hypothetical protein